MGIKAYFELIRLNNCLMASFGAFIGGLIASYFNLEMVNNLIFASIVVFLVCGFGNALNDIYDLKIDRINKPERPIPSKRISLTNARIFSYLLVFTGLCISLFNITCFLMAVLNSIVLQQYASTYKKNKIIGNLIVAYLTGSVFIFGGIAVGNIDVTIMLFLCALFAMWSREIIKDYEDIEGDIQEKVISIPIKCGENSIYIAALLLVFAVLLSSLPYLFGFFGIYYLISVVFCDLLFLIGIFPLLINPSRRGAKNASRNIKIVTNLVLVAFVIGSFFK
ncbi:geranylgeranylglycerol-phosphate geranylgeranyltransferase [Methanococcus maripaludis C5]|uniref:Digeranylgeranylglyceryl phosphate synthase n=1 Tax=Methanococcus maripaludis (strain C5 / ATCC BAA-1333) TaxID=402880 RepID=DGGGP_METM5|nr:UbiA family prenyltransferase [Methanococcus maripaludis]A4G0P3.1 RecName: Full=Digeranylgeranylglyceryl phosphate synthase; Short=DGGGP synthase; Short=DGGGPS; AltName: Full=(S)-2,3-di-O-geranylgeranylglyceryl phosphate synthase; AltName: Full=Geranylgeranylglycerol-phosphate geranylgeranyltransferase [Methanococcus maripaludis C5]ABO36027.1 geranylgeranylglycerol-phosphate geranylgeranyltransferase [Methanococcus maripaludis C5]